MHFHSKAPYKHGRNSYLILLGIYTQKYLLLNGLPEESPPSTIVSWRTPLNSILKMQVTVW